MRNRKYKTVEFPRSRIATFDIGAIGKEKHYVTALLELDVTEARRKIRAARRTSGQKLSFNGWLLKAIAETIGKYPEVAAYRCGRRKLIVFDDVDISIIVEKEINGTKVPLPLVIGKANEKSAAAISAEIEKARTKELSKERMVLEQGASLPKRLYYFLPGAMRRLAWRIMLRRPRFVFGKMGNVVVSSVGMMGRVNGWFVQTSVHPLSFGIGAITRKPVAAGDEIWIGEVLHMTVLLDHNAIDGAPMARFIKALTENIENGIGL
ncbi:MAG: 2-oxo acid dehydrogenase subunit E2 [Candidatus Aminicenantes bacterium]|nr:2-oxo acid dehydrogenase subunit E2 [Candidatus Aminicenantes bacterium]